MPTIEWFDPEEDVEIKEVIALLKGGGHEVNYHNNLTQDEIDKLKKNKVDLIVTELSFGSAKPVPDFQGINPRDAGLYLLEQLCQRDSVNEFTPKLVYTLVSDISCNLKAAEYVGNNIVHKATDDIILQKAIYSILPTQAR